MKYTKFVFFLFLVSSLNGQTKKPFKLTAVSFTADESLELKNLQIYKYPKEFAIINQLKTINEVTNKTPEDVLMSDVGASSQAWINKNYENGVGPQYSEEDLKTRIGMLPEYVIFPKMKIYYENNSNKYCFVKYATFVKKLNMYFANSLVMHLKDNTWAITGGRDFFYAKLLFEVIKTEILIALFEGKEVKDELLNKLIKNTRNRKGELDYFKLNKNFNSWKKGSPEWKHFVEENSLANNRP